MRTNTEHYDVVVIGAGFAGLTAAIAARQAGATVLVIEKMKAVGGNSIISDGGMAVSGSALQRAAGITDTPEAMYDDMMRAGRGLSHPHLVRTVVDRAVDAFEWLVDEIGVPFIERVDMIGGHSVARNHAAAGITGASIVRPLYARVRELGIAVRFGTVLRALAVDNVGRVCGVDVQREYDFRVDVRAGAASRRSEGAGGAAAGGRSEGAGGERGGGAIAAASATAVGTARAAATEHIDARSVVLATGGFAADVPFRRMQDPRLDGTIDTTNKPVATAEGLIAALRVGAVPVGLSHIQLAPSTSPDERGFGAGPTFSEYIGFVRGVIVHPETGARFVDERADRKTVADAILATGKPCICIATADAVDSAGWDISAALKRGVLRTFTSVDELATAHNMPPGALRDTLEEAFGERFHQAPADSPADSTAAGSALPLYAMRLWPKAHFTMGGVGIDEMARVLDLTGTPIPGLYAAGEVTGGVHGASRLGSCAITECVVFGRIAGHAAAAFLRDGGAGGG